jgi:hypothetical protein
MTERTASPTTFAQTYFHGTKADLKPGDLIERGFSRIAAGIIRVLHLNH